MYCQTDVALASSLLELFNTQAGCLRYDSLVRKAENECLF